MWWNYERKISVNFDEKNIICATKNLYILFNFLLIALSIYYYIIKYQARQKHLLPVHVINSKRKEVVYWKEILKMNNKFKAI